MMSQISTRIFFVLKEGLVKLTVQMKMRRRMTQKLLLLKTYSREEEKKKAHLPMSYLVRYFDSFALFG